jgi:FkbM family methyltransferase
VALVERSVASAYEGGRNDSIRPIDQIMNEKAAIDKRDFSRLRVIRTLVGFDLLADPGDTLGALLLRDAIFEAPETDLVTRILRPGDICVDGGCHLGYYSCLFAQLVGESGQLFSFDANPRACQNTRTSLALNGLGSATVFHSALADASGNRSFYISTDDQTGLSSLGSIPTCKEIISVPCLSLEGFLNEHNIHNLRLLKLDVEGSEEMVLRGLGQCLGNHLIDFILIECFDERLGLLNSSAESVGHLLTSAGYTCWEYGRANPAGWSRAIKVTSRDDCNYLFSSPAIADESFARVSLATALAWTQAEKNVLSRENSALGSNLETERNALSRENGALRSNLEKSQEDIDWLLSSINDQQEELARLRAEAAELCVVLGKVTGSAGWRILEMWRRVRDRFAPDHSKSRRVYDAILQRLRRRVEGPEL